MHGFDFQVSGQGYGGTKNMPKDHFRENVKRMRQIQRMSKEKEVESVKPMKALWKSEKYADVPSKIKMDMSKEPLPPRPQSAGFLRAHTRSGPSVKLQNRPYTPDPKLSVPPADSASDVNMVRNDFDFIKINGKLAKNGKMVRAPSLTALDDLKKKQEEELRRYKKGEVPTYLQQRKRQWKKNEEDRIANAPDPECPEGHRVLPDAERRETLQLLKSKQEELTSKLLSLPLRTDTYRMRSCKQELDNKLAEMDEAIKIFSRPKVFVKCE